jgi:short-chain 2-methylacyl-CoA dehydrogenase
MLSYEHRILILHSFTPRPSNLLAAIKQGMQHQYAQIATEIHAAEVMMYNACRLKEAGLPFVKEASMVKLYSSQVAEKAASKTIEMLGGIGFTKDLLAEKMYRDCKVRLSYDSPVQLLPHVYSIVLAGMHHGWHIYQVGSIYEGTSNIQLQTIAKILSADYK